MQNRLLPAFFASFALFCALAAQAQTNTLTITGTAYPTCSCTGFIDISLSYGPQQPPSSGVFKYSWSNGATTQDISDLCPGQYCVTVEEVNGIASATQCFTVVKLPNDAVEIVSSNTAPCNFDSTGISSFCEKVCPGTTVTYTVFGQPAAGSGGIPVGWNVVGASSWSVNSGSNPSVSSITVTWGTVGTGRVTVSIDSQCGGEDVICVTVIDEPVAKLASQPSAAVAGGPLQVCLGQTVQFQNLSTGDVDRVQWLFSDDLSASSTFNASHTYLTPGTHTVRLVVSSNCLCADTTEMLVEVLNAQAPSLNCVATVCPGASVTYVVAGGCAPYQWSVSSQGVVLEGGTPQTDSVTVQWLSGPSGTITLGAQACSGAVCPVPSVISVPVISGDAQIRGKDRVCPGATEVYSIEPYGGTGFTWTLPTGGTIVSGQGTNRIVVDWSSAPNPPPASAHQLTVQYDNCYLGCGGADVLPVRILSAFHIEGPVERCDGAAGSFSARLNLNNALIGCNWALYGPNGGLSWVSPMTANTANAPFSDGPGLYRLFATPSNPDLSCTETADWAIQVRALPAEPTAILGETVICPGTTYTYRAGGLPAGASVRWEVKNGPGAAQTSQGNPINVTWGAVGPYWLTAIQVSKDGLNCTSDTVGLLVNAIQGPLINGATPMCDDTKAAYSTAALANVAFAWSVTPADAGTVAQGQGTNGIEVFWSNPGNHQVNLSVCGQTASFPVTIFANPAPTVLTPPGLCPGETGLVQTSAPFVSYLWKNEFGAPIGSTASLMLPAGIYSVEVTDANGCRSVETFKVNAYLRPNISLTTAQPTGFCNNSVTVTLNALANTQGSYTYQWFQDGSLIPGAVNASFATNQYGLYTVQATNSQGCSSSAGPVSLFNHCGGGGGGAGPPGFGNPPCPPGSAQLVTDPSTRCDSAHFSILDFTGLLQHDSTRWITGVSGGFLVGAYQGSGAGFVYPNAGNYAIIATLTFSNGDVCDLVDFLDVSAVARFLSFPACPGDVSMFENSSEILPNSGISQYSWTFGDPASGANNSSMLENPGHLYSASGTYQVTLTTTSLSGCTSSQTVTVLVPDAPPPFFNDPVPNCVGGALEFVASLPAPAVKLLWDFGDPASGAANTASGGTVYHLFPAGTYLVSVQSENLYGCTATFTAPVTVQPNLFSGNISPAAPLPICEGSSIVLTAPAGAATYLWSDDSQTTSQSLTVSTEGSYRVTVTDANGCTYSPPPVDVRVNPSPDAILKALLMNELGQTIGTSSPNLTICHGENTALQLFSNGAGTYNWSGGLGTDQIVFFTDDRNTLLPVGIHLYTVTVTSAATGCTAVSDPFLITVNPRPSGFFVTSPTICAGSPNVIDYNGPTPANWQLVWNTGATGTSITTSQAGGYFVRVINEFGCDAKSNVHTVLPGPAVANVPSGCHTRCKPDQICVPNIPDIVSWQWFWNGSPISGANSPNLTATESGTYWAQLTDINGCTASSDPLSLSLYDGFGNIYGNVWSDVNNNGIIDPADTLVPGVTILVFQNNNPFGTVSSGATGAFAMANVLSTEYAFQIDPMTLPPNWQIRIGQAQAILIGCNVAGQVDFLLRFACQISGGTVQLTACPGGSAIYNGTSIPTGGSQTFTVTSTGGCDSTFVVSVSALPITTSSVALLACPGSSATYNGVSIPVGGTQQFVLNNASGCDSVVTVTVSALPTSTGNVALQACPGSSATYNGVSIPVGGTQQFVLNNASGCDSVVTVTVSALPTSTGSVALQACPGSSATYNGVSIPVGNTQQFVLSNASGCDSVVTVTVSELSAPPATAFSVGVCPGGQYVYQGTLIPVGTSQQFVLQGTNGCDSTVTVSVFQKNATSNVLQVSVCPGQTYMFMGQEIAPGESRAFQLINSEGCDSTLTIAVSAYPSTDFSVLAAASCQSSPTGELVAQNPSGGPSPFQYSLDNTSYQAQPNFNDLSAGAYQLYLRDGNGCVSVRDAVINGIPRIQIDLSDGILPCDSAGVVLRPLVVGGDTSSLRFRWWNGSQSDQTLATDVGPIWLEVTDKCGTERADASVRWADLPANTDIVYVPNVFMPSSSDAENARFKPYFSPYLTLLSYRFQVYDRWGDKVFETRDIADAWDGVARAQKNNPAVLVWVLEAEVAMCGRVMQVKRKGDVSLVR